LAFFRSESISDGVSRVEAVKRMEIAFCQGLETVPESLAPPWLKTGQLFA